MLEITSTFGISFDLFNLAFFGKNYGLKTPDTLQESGSAVFWPIPAKRRIEMSHTLVFFSKNLTLQNAPGAKV